jgi:DNA helicase HerA-like ATPase
MTKLFQENMTENLITNLASLDFSTVYLPIPNQASEYRFFKIKEIPETKSSQNRLAMVNVLAGLQQSKQSFVYVLSGTDKGVELYIGVKSDNQASDIHDAGQALRYSFEGNFLGAQLEKVSQQNIDQLKIGKHLGFISGVPSFNEDEGNAGSEDVQGIERLVNSLLGKTWQLTVVSQAISSDEINQQICQLWDISTELSQHIKLSVQKSQSKGWQSNTSEGRSESDTSGTSETDTKGSSKGYSESHGTSKGHSESRTKSTNTSETKGDSKSHNSSSSSRGTNSSNTTSDGISENYAQNAGTNSSKTTNNGTNESFSKGISYSKTQGSNTSYSSGLTGGDSESHSHEQINQRVESLHKYVTETLLNRFLLGQTKGLFKTAIYVSSDNRAIYDRLTSGVLSLFQGNKVSMVPMKVHDLSDKYVPFNALLSFKQIKNNDLTNPNWKKNALLQSIPANHQHELVAATAITTRELALVVGMPNIELPGLKLRKSVDFAVNVPEVENPLMLGGVIQHGRNLSHLNKASRYYQVCLNKKDFNKHIFICGVTGAGKTTTCMRLLLESNLPFIVIEPAKTEYRALYGQDQQIEYYAIGREDLTPFRLNPFELVKGEQLAGHIQMLTATLQAVFPMEAAMPYMVEEAIINAYKNKGWDIYSNENFLIDEPYQSGSNAYPTFSDMIKELDNVILSKGLGKEFEEKYRGSLIARFTNLIAGIKGRMLNCRHSIDFDKLLDKKVVIELEEIKDEQDKALLMGLIIVRLSESMKHRHQKNQHFQHLTLIEEAHRLLSRLEAGDSGSKKLGIEMFANLLAEVRKYGEGLIIADQIPNKLVPDVIKNTNTKIVHRLFAADDRDVIGDTMSLNDEQKEFLPLLKVGEAIVYSGGWHAPVWVKVDESQSTTDKPIDESLIKLKGQKQLWEQRQELFPSLTKYDVLNEQKLSNFLGNGFSIITLMLKLNQLKSKSNDEIKTRFYERLRQKLDSQANLFAGNKQQLSMCLTDLFLDVTSIDNTNEFREGIEKVFIALQESLVEFETISCSDRLVKNTLSHLTIDSI